VIAELLIPAAVFENSRDTEVPNVLLYTVSAGNVTFTYPLSRSRTRVFSASMQPFDTRSKITDILHVVKRFGFIHTSCNKALCGGGWLDGTRKRSLHRDEYVFPSDTTCASTSWLQTYCDLNFPHRMKKVFRLIAGQVHVL